MKRLVSRIGVAGVVLLTLGATPATQPTNKRADPNTEQERTSRIIDLQQKLSNLPPESPDRPAIASEILRLRGLKLGANQDRAAVTPVHKPAKADKARTRITGVVDPRATAEVVAQTRENLSKEYSDKIETLQQSDPRVAELRRQIYLSHSTAERKNLGDQVREITKQNEDALSDARAQKAELEQMSDGELAVVVSNVFRQQDEEARQRKAAQEAQAQKLAAIRQALWPGFNGPWKTCPICGGTGRDADAERDVNSRNASIVASQNVQGIVKIPGAVVACSVCGGTGQVPA